ncbi:MAG: alpha/beta hydrolase [Thermosipho sp. (in: Bacteria)]|nr:alpha/beta hydrolase [Thermosipho sp. (in: thermotogales)]
MKNKNYIIFFKVFLSIFLIILSVFNLCLTLLVLFLIELPVIRKALLGKLPFDLGKEPWKEIKTFQYDENLKLDIYYPNGEGPYHLILFAHGGGWISGYRRQPNNVSWYKYLVSNNFAVATLDYRYAYFYEIEHLLNDFGNALNFLVKNAKELEIDVNNISLMGLSAGGHLTLYFVVTKNPEVKNVVAYYSPTDLLDIWKSNSLFARFAVSTTLKRLPNKSKKVYEKYSPINYVKKDLPPILLVHGLKDSVIPYISSVKMYKKLRSYKNSSKLLLHPEGDHGFEFVLKDDKTKEILRKTVMFLRGELYDRF